MSEFWPKAEARELKPAPRTPVPKTLKMRSIFREEEERQNERALAKGRSEGVEACSACPVSKFLKMRSIFKEEEERRKERALAKGRSEGYEACSDDRVGPAR